MSSKVIKFFYNTEGGFKVVVDGEEEKICNLILTCQTQGGKSISLISHIFEVCPYIEIDKKISVVTSISPNGIKYGIEN